MALATKAPKADPKPKVRILDQSEAHVIELKLNRADNTGVLASAVVDLVGGKVVIRQETTPITFKSVEDFGDIIEFYEVARDYLADAPAPVVQVDAD